MPDVTSTIHSQLLYFKMLKMFIKRFIQLLEIPVIFFKNDWRCTSKSRLTIFFEIYLFYFSCKSSARVYIASRLWKIQKSDWKYYFGSPLDPYQNLRLSTTVQPDAYRILFDDKFLCYQLCVANSLPTPFTHGIIYNIDGLKSFFKKYPHRATIFVVKPLYGKGGNNIYFLKCDDQVCMSHKNQLVSFDMLPNSIFPAILQENVTQHEKLSSVSESLNTIRLLTLYTADMKSLIIFATIRFGVNSLIDNVCAGGVAAKINIDSGKIEGDAKGFDLKAYACHPVSNVNFNNFKIPLWEKVLKLGIETQASFPCYKLLGLDVAVANDGPKIIEINSKPDIAGIEMSGPILRNPKVRKEFERHRILVNNCSFT